MFKIWNEFDFLLILYRQLFVVVLNVIELCNTKKYAFYFLELDKM